jgi:hypothetical protein
MPHKDKRIKIELSNDVELKEQEINIINLKNKKNKTTVEIKELQKLRRRKVYLKQKNTLEYKIINARRVKEWRIKNDKKYKEWRKQRNKTNPRVYEVRNKYRNERKKNDINFKILGNLRNRLWFSFKRGLVKKNIKTLDLIGTSIENLILHLEKSFKPGMTRENYGEWHIDHIKPISKFDLNDENEQKKCFHYTNLQPLWASENIKKSDKYVDK